MANIGATTAFYKVETSLSRANTEVSKSMERLIHSGWITWAQKRVLRVHLL